MPVGLGALQLLVIDDNAQMRTIVGTVLAAAGARHIYYAADGRQGLEIVGARKIDVAYVDHEMPVMNGLEFISAVRALETLDQFLPIIMLTGHSDLRRLNEARDRGVTEFVAKPVSAKTILTRLDAVIQRPRPFVRSDSYFGPDRRRHDGSYEGPMRRRSDHPEAEPPPT
ncbi:MAG: response regulator [Caulobacterales bacterium]